MSVLIKDMEMPTHCIDCPFMVSRDGDDCILQSAEANAGFENWEQMKAGCPLVPVPPHGDLIDRREAIVDANERTYDFWLSDDEVNATIQFLKEQPTIIPAEGGE